MLRRSQGGEAATLDVEAEVAMLASTSNLALPEPTVAQKAEQLLKRLSASTPARKPARLTISSSTGRRDSLAGPPPSPQQQVNQVNPVNQSLNNQTVSGLVAAQGEREVAELLGDRVWRTYAIRKCGLLRRPVKAGRKKRDDLLPLKFFVERIRDTIQEAWPDLQTLSVTEWGDMVRVSVRMAAIPSEVALITYMNIFMRSDPTVIRYKIRKNASLWATRVVQDTEHVTDKGGKAGRLVFTMYPEALRASSLQSKDDIAKEMQRHEDRMNQALDQNKRAVAHRLIPLNTMI